jgi:hypothetical protein
MVDREDAIDAIITDTGKTREQAEAFLDIAGSAFRRRGWADGEPLSRSEIAERLRRFVGDAESAVTDDVP